MSPAKGARFTLRELTAEQHDRVDALYAGFDPSQPNGYRRMLSGLAGAFLPVEAALDDAGAPAILPDWPQRRRAALLRADLHALAVQVPPMLPPPPFSDEPSVWGGIYVLEGSRLGGEMLRRGLCRNAPTAFLGAPQPPGAWRKLLDSMEEALYSPERIAGAAAAARAVFERFELSGSREWECVRE